MLKKSIFIGIMLGASGVSMNFATAGITCPVGQIPVKFTGTGNTNAFVDSNGISASLGTTTLIETTGNIQPLTCAVRGIPTITGFTPPSTINATFISYIQCRDRFHSELVSTSTAQLTYAPGQCGSGDYDPGNTIKGPFTENGDFVGKWGIFKGITQGVVKVQGTSNCGLQDWKVSAEVCMPINQNGNQNGQ